MNLIINIFAVIGFICSIALIIRAIYILYVNLRSYFKDFKKIRSTKHFKEIQIKE